MPKYFCFKGCVPHAKSVSLQEGSRLSNEYGMINDIILDAERLVATTLPPVGGLQPFLSYEINSRGGLRYPSVLYLEVTQGEATYEVARINHGNKLLAVGYERLKNKELAMFTVYCDLDKLTPQVMPPAVHPQTGNVLNGFACDGHNKFYLES